MRRRTIATSLILAGLLGLAQIAIACPTSTHDCCQTGSLPQCCERAPVQGSVESHPCCVSPAPVTASISPLARSRSGASDVPGSPDPVLATAIALPPGLGGAQIDLPNQAASTLVPDQSLTYLRTARLRL